LVQDIFTPKILIDVIDERLANLGDVQTFYAPYIFIYELVRRPYHADGDEVAAGERHEPRYDIAGPRLNEAVWCDHYVCQFGCHILIPVCCLDVFYLAFFIERLQLDVNGKEFETAPMCVRKSVSGGLYL
jgi:hypothetical protein